ncbi:hypothetical protein [Lactiplantibacillus fabifermentans]|uniref:Extracellular protein n=2 Tax=Lactiplantibacillus fabifermentans TaxID=483011 RepID=A0A0R2NU92_9LACO|nr:hypothetical protein [Lactiplantibacillus fabifermentans]ETY73546.1 hypothetical protein LFAB_11730 [Lactiplantibacillus fabifermentans T30PCM01]KRO27459.1 hypothetical protein DY78_GL003207 [Lactiplantibacillus fabifermentans DSM 21115]
MKKTIITTSLLVGIAVLGGGYYFWPRNTQSTSSATQAMSESVASQQTSHSSTAKSAAKKATTKHAAKAASTTGTATSTTSAAVSSSQRSAKSSQASSHQAELAGTTSVSGTSSSRSSSSSSSSTEAPVNDHSKVKAATNLTTDQVNNWVFEQVAPKYQVSVTKNDFLFNQATHNDGLVYVEVYENMNDEVSHLVGRYRIDSHGALEQQQINQGADVWAVVSAAYK